MRKPILVLNLALLAAAFWLAGGMRAAWRGNHVRYGRFPALVSLNGTAPFAAAPGSPAANYAGLVARNLFSADRNNEQPVIKTEKKAAPPVPYVIGTMNLGSGVVALMADEKQVRQGTFRRVKVGDEVAGYHVAEIADHRVIIEFAGEKTTIDVYESAEEARRAVGASYSPEAATSSPASQPQVVSAVPASGTAESATAAGGSTGTPSAVPANADGSLGVRVEGNWKIYTRATPWGVQTWKEPATPGKQ